MPGASGGATVARLRFEFLGDLAGYRSALKAAKSEGDAAAKSMGQGFKDALKAAVAPKTVAAPLGKDWVRSQMQAFITANPTANMETLLAKQRAIRLEAARHTIELSATSRAMKTLSNAAGTLGSALKSAFNATIHKAFNAGLNIVKGTLSGIAGMMKTVGKGFLLGAGFTGFQAIGRALGDALSAIPDLITKGREYVRIIDDVADSTGAGAEETSKFVGVLGYLGVPLNGLINMIGQASRNLELMTPRLRALGIVVEDSNGFMLNQIQILFNARKAMSEWGLGTEKANIIAREFGRGGLKTLVDFLNLSDEQFNIVVADLKNAGLIITEEQRNMAEAAVREGARFEQTWTGLGVTLFTAVGPAIMAFMSRITEFIRAHVEDIKNAVANVVSFLFGLVTSILGMSTGLDSFSASLEAMNPVLNPYSAGVNELTDEITRLNGKHKAAVATTADARRGYEAQIKVIDKQITALDKLVKAEDRVYASRMKSIKSVIDEKLAMLDAAEAAEELAQKQLGLNEQLNEAQIALAEAQKGDRGKVDADAIAKAMADVVSAQRAISELAREQEVAAQRSTLTNAQAYIENVTKLVEDAENRKAVAKTLGRKQATLQDELALAKEKGNADEIAVIQAKLDAVQAALEQNAARMRTDDRRRELDERKAMLQEEKAAVVASTTSATDTLIAQKERELAAQKEKAAAWQAQQDAIDKVRGVLALLGIDADTILGIKFGDDMKQVFADIGTAIQGVIGWVKELASAIDNVILGVRYLTDDAFRAQVNKAAGLEGIKVPTFTDLFGNLTGLTQLDELVSWLKGLAPGGGNAAGGLVGARGPERSWLGERGAEWVINAPALRALASLNRNPMQAITAVAGGGGIGGQQAVIRLELGGRPLLDYMDENLIYRRRI
jgi:hypothetical protein